MTAGSGGVRRDADDVLRELAGRAQGIVTRQEALSAGVSSKRLERRLRWGMIESVYRGVYRVRGMEGPHWREMAAIRACGAGGVVGGPSAAALRHRTIERLVATARAAEPEAVHVILREGSRRPAGVLIRRCRLAEDEVAEVDGVPVTTSARTVLDLAGTLSPGGLERHLATALDFEGCTTGAVRRLLDRHPNARGAGILRALLAGQAPARTASAAEAAALRLFRRGGLAPECNVRLEGWEVDFLWREERLVVEVDGFAFHRSRGAFERDRRRDAALSRAGYRVLRFSWEQIHQEAEATLLAVAEVLWLGRVGRR